MVNYLTSFFCPSSLFILFRVKIDNYNWNESKEKGINIEKNYRFLLLSLCVRSGNSLTLKCVEWLMSEFVG